jgi:hypothetical protein
MDKNTDTEHVKQAMYSLGFHVDLEGNGVGAYRMASDDARGVATGWVNKMLEHFRREPCSPVEMYAVTVQAVGGSLPTSMTTLVAFRVLDPVGDTLEEVCTSVEQIRNITKGWA